MILPSSWREWKILLSWRDFWLWVESFVRCLLVTSLLVLIFCGFWIMPWGLGYFFYLWLKKTRMFLISRDFICEPVLKSFMKLRSNLSQIVRATLQQCPCPLFYLSFSILFICQAKHSEMKGGGDDDNCGGGWGEQTGRSLKKSSLF